MKKENKNLENILNDLYLLEKQARDLYDEYLKDLEDKKEREVVIKIRNDEIKHMDIAKQLIKIAKANK